MIKFFRKIRKSLVSQGKTSKYFKYAIGEIVLVVIGILIALQINTWSNNRELKKEEVKILKSLLQEFSENLSKFDKIYEAQLKRKKDIEAIMSDKVQDLSTDSLGVLITSVDANYTFDPFQGIYNSVINSGKIELISNDILKNKISRIQDLIIDYKEEEDGVQNHAVQNLFPFQLKQPFRDFNFSKGGDEKSMESIQVKENYIKLIKSNEFNNLMMHLRGWMRAIFGEGPILRKEMVSIINLLEEEIKKHK